MITDLRSFFFNFVSHEIQISLARSSMHFGWVWAFNIRYIFQSFQPLCSSANLIFYYVAGTVFVIWMTSWTDIPRESDVMHRAITSSYWLAERNAVSRQHKRNKTTHACLLVNCEKERTWERERDSQSDLLLMPSWLSWWGNAHVCV